MEYKDTIFLPKSSFEMRANLPSKEPKILEDWDKQNIFKQLVEIDNRVYKHHVWYARSLSDDSVDKALKHLNTAIKISPSESDAYREIIRIGQDLNDIELTSKYCKIYPHIGSENITIIFAY